MITETFDVGTGLPGLGDWSLTLKAGTAQRLLGPSVAATLSNQKPGPTENWRHSMLVVTDGRVSSPDRAGVLARALYAGELLRFDFTGKAEPWRIGGRSMLNWLGDDDGKGPAIHAGTDYTTAAPYTGTAANYLLALVAGGWTNGIDLDATAASVDTGTFAALELRIYEVARQRINKLCQATTPRTEYWLDPTDLTCYFAGEGDTTNGVFRWDPRCMFSTEVGASTEASLTSYDCDVAVSIDYGNVATGLRVENAAGTSVNTSGTSDPLRNDATGTATGDRGKFLGAGDEVFSQYADAHFPTLMNLLYSRSDTVSVTVPGDVCVRRNLKPGDHCYVWEPLWGVLDPTVTVVHDGKSCQPRKVRCSSIRWPVQKGMGVYLIHVETEYGGVNAVQDLTEDVEFERAATAISLATASPTTLTRIVRGSQYRPRWEDR